VRIGVFLTAVLLSDGSCGVSGTVTDHPLNCSKENRDFGEFTPSKIKGRRVSDLFATVKNLKILDSLRLATLNAVSSRIISDSDYKIIEDADPIDFIDLNLRKTITLVGAFQSYIRKISESGNKLHVLELSENALNPDQKQFYVPADEYARILSVSDTVIITGLTLANNTIDDLLAAIPAGCEIIVTGPSCNLLPDVLFEKNVKILGATRFTNPEMVLDIVSEAGTGYHLFKYCAKKICIFNEK
jgi:uncharacterized protein (DUF4213/DUF364 family)